MSADLLIGVYPPMAPGTALGRPLPPVFPFDRPGVALTHLGRGAVWLALRALGLGPGSRIAMPAYHCGSEVEAAHLAGCEIDFYRVDADLQVDEEDLARAAAGADAAYLISCFGFAMPGLPEGVAVIEDAAHALYSGAAGTPIGSRGDASVFCPRKTLGVPDGGAVLVSAGPAPRPVGHPDARAMLRSTASLLAGRGAIARARPVRAACSRVIAGASRGDAAARGGTLTEVVIGEWDLEVADMESAASGPAPLTARIVARADGPAIRTVRRRNYEILRDGGLAEYAPEPFRDLPAGIAPLYFPIAVPDRDDAIVRLLDHGVRGLEIWPVPHPLLDRERFAELEPARRSLLSLPVHQHLEPWHMERVLGAAKVALAR